MERGLDHKLANYTKAVQLLEKMAQKEVPIKKTDFLKTHKLDARLFVAMENLHLINPEVSAHREGTIYSWKSPKKGEDAARLVVAEIQRLNREAYDYYNDPKVQKKRAVQAWKKSQEKSKPAASIAAPAAATPAPEAPATATTPAEPGKPGAKKTEFSLTGSFAMEEILSKLNVLLENKPISSFSFQVNYEENL